MSYKTSIIVSISCFFLLLAWAFHPLIFFMIAMTDGPPRRGNPLDSWQTTNNHFKIRITAYQEDGAFLSGTYYGFDSASFESDSWREFMVTRYDDGPEIPRDQVRFVTDKVAYAYMGRVYCVTIDGGETWVVTDMRDQLADVQKGIQGYIQGVEIGTDGAGKIQLYGGIELKTRNYGQEWRL